MTKALFQSFGSTMMTKRRFLAFLEKIARNPANSLAG